MEILQIGFVLEASASSLAQGNLGGNYQESQGITIAFRN